MGTGERRAVNGVRRAPTPSGDPVRGRFIVLEGIDGAGKSEQRGRLVAWLRTRDREVVETSEPTDGAWGRRVRDFLAGRLEATPDEVLGFFAADRREHVDSLVLPALERGAIVVSDRYVYSSLAYQAAHGADRASLRARLEVDRLPVPDLALWLRLPVAEALARLADARADRFESAEFLARVDAEYAALGLEALDASPPPDIVGAAIRERVKHLLRENAEP